MEFNLRLYTIFTILSLYYLVFCDEDYPEIPSYFFSVNPKSQDVVEGREVSLKCDVSDRTHIEFSWHLNGKKISNTNRRFQQGRELRILRVMRGLDEGPFTCEAAYVIPERGPSSSEPRPNYAIISQEAKLNIQWIEDTVDLQLKKPKTKDQIKPGKNFTLKCAIKGSEEPSYLFYRNSYRLFPNNRIHITNENLLEISKVKPEEDNGVYSCQAENDAGKRQSQKNLILNLKVLGGPNLIEDKFTPYVVSRKNSPASIHCPFERASRIDWYFNQNEKIRNDDKHTLYKNGTLYINRVEKADEGVYRCEGSNSRTSERQAFSATLKLMYINNFDYTSFEPRLRLQFPIVVALNNKFEMKCFPPKANPPATIRWLGRTNQRIPSAGPISVTSQGTLVFERIQQKDTGNYTCIASNSVGEKRRSVAIVVSIKPNIYKSPRQQKILEGSPVIFECAYKGTPYPITVVTWTKEGITLREDRRVMVDRKRGRLKILNVKLEDRGNYKCEVNTTGHAVVSSGNAFLDVKRTLKFKPKPKDVVLDLNSTSTVQCSAEADYNDKVTIKWLKLPISSDKFDFKIPLNLPQHVQENGGILLFKRVKLTDAGDYMCVAHAKETFINATVKVKVIVKPQFVIRPRNTTVLEGRPVTLHCKARGDPKPKIIWDKDKGMKSRQQNRFRIFANGSLHVSAVYVEDQGIYGCTANSSGGMIRAEAFLSVRTEGEWGDHKDDEDEEGISMVKTIIIAVCSAGAYLALVIGLTAFCSYRLLRNKKSRKATIAGKPLNGDVSNREHMELLGSHPEHESLTQIKSESDNRSHVSGMSSQPSHSSQSQQARSRRGSYDRLQFPRHDLETIGKLGQGIFGEVYLAKAHGIRNNESETHVVVKSFLAKEQHLYQDFRQEMEMYTHMDHENVASLLGVCREQDPHLAITEYYDWGDLKQFLLATRQDNGKHMARVSPLTFDQKVNICHQVAQGMDYISRNRYIHRDLASRNVLLSPRLGIKVTNLALCKDVYACEYYAHKNTLIPLRWMPPEAVVDDEFSVKSDVWSYGVFMWEVFTSGDIPYKSRSDEEVMKGMKVGDVSLEFGEQCTDEIIDVIHKCTSESADDRPLFSLVCLMVKDVLMPNA